MSELGEGPFLANKLYGAPYMPRNGRELLFYLQVLAIEAKESIRHQFSTIQKSPSYPYNVFAIISSLIVSYWIWLKLVLISRTIWGYGLIEVLSRGYRLIVRFTTGLFFKIPSVRSKIDAEVNATRTKIETSIVQNSPDLIQTTKLPKHGMENDAIVEELDKLHELKHSDWGNGRVLGAVYHGGEELGKLQVEAYHKNYVANQLHPDVFPGVRKMEAETVSMVLDIFNAPAEGCGSSTSGGTESLLLAGLAAREYGRKYKSITAPEVIAPVTIHAGIEKACYYFGMKLHKVNVDPITFQVDLAQVRRLINGNTVLLCGSAPNFPHGIIDDIEGLSKLAVKYNIPLHVDACLGSFIVTFLEKSKVHGTRKLPKFDFRVPGVTSISCDTHKYGFAPKGSSIIMYRSPKLRECQYYVLSDWTGGMYGSPTLAGSRPGALMAGCWATLVSIGEDGYTKSCLEIVTALMKLKKAIEENVILSKYLEVIGDPLGSVVSFRAKGPEVNIYILGDLLTKKGWHFSALQNPAALHFAFTKLTVPIVDELITDLVETTTEAASADVAGGTSDTRALYGVAGSVSTLGVADRLIVAFLDTLYKV